MAMGGFAEWVAAAWRRTRVKAAGRELELVETLALGGRRQLSLVVCGGERFLVGCGADSVTSIVAVKGTETFSSSAAAKWGAGF